MKNLYQQTHFDFPMTFLCTNYWSIDKINIFKNTSYTVIKLTNHQVFGPLVSV